MKYQMTRPMTATEQAALRTHNRRFTLQAIGLEADEHRRYKVFYSDRPPVNDYSFGDLDRQHVRATLAN